MVTVAAGSPAIRDRTLETIVATLVTRVRPELIVLFGSRAAGTARADSDYDLMVVFADAADTRELGTAAHRALRDAHVSADVLPRTASQYRRRQHDPGFLDWLVSREGRVLYASGAVAQRSPVPPRVSEDAAENGVDMWLERARSDLHAAGQLVDAKQGAVDAVCFHSHACAEKLLKAAIVRTQSIFPPRTHKLEDLLSVQPEAIGKLAVVREACSLLDRLYPSSRYPELPMPSADDARRAYTAAREVWDAVAPFVGG